MAPGEEDEEEFAEDVGCADVEVVFQGWDGDVAVQLYGLSVSMTVRSSRG